MCLVRFIPMCILSSPDVPGMTTKLLSARKFATASNCRSVMSQASVDNSRKLRLLRAEGEWLRTEAMAEMMWLNNRYDEEC